MRRPLARETPTRSTTMRWWARRRRVPIATCSTASTRRAPTNNVNANTTKYNSDNGQPSCPISLVTVLGRPSGPSTKSRLAIAMPALNEESTAAPAVACHSTTVARGARIGHVARASSAGTGPISRSATTVKASADTLTVSQSPPVPPAGWVIRCLASSSARARRPRRRPRARRNAPARPAGRRSPRPGLARRPPARRRVRRDDAWVRSGVPGHRGAVPRGLLRQPLQNVHDGRIGEVSTRRQRFVNLTDGLRVRGRPTRSITARSNSPNCVKEAYDEDPDLDTLIAAPYFRRSG